MQNFFSLPVICAQSIQNQKIANYLEEIINWMWKQKEERNKESTLLLRHRYIVVLHFYCRRQVIFPSTVLLLFIMRLSKSLIPTDCFIFSIFPDSHSVSSNYELVLSQINVLTQLGLLSQVGGNSHSINLNQMLYRCNLK